MSAAMNAPGAQPAGPWQCFGADEARDALALLARTRAALRLLALSVRGVSEVEPSRLSVVTGLLSDELNGLQALLDELPDVPEGLNLLAPVDLLEQLDAALWRAAELNTGPDPLEVADVADMAAAAIQRVETAHGDTLWRLADALDPAGKGGPA